MNQSTQPGRRTRNSSVPHPCIKWFADIAIGDIPLVGGKNASLGEMVRELTASVGSSDDAGADLGSYLPPHL